MNPIWRAIVIHHSDAADDLYRSDWEGTRRYHMSWRHDGKIITPDEAQKLIDQGAHGVEAPWNDIGYHFGLEMVKGRIEERVGRPLTERGSHCHGMNDRAIGICCLGDYDREQPSGAMYYACAELCVKLMSEFPLIANLNLIFPHSAFSQKTCPGAHYSMHHLRDVISALLAVRA